MWPPVPVYLGWSTLLLPWEGWWVTPLPPCWLDWCDLSNDGGCGEAAASVNDTDAPFLDRGGAPVFNAPPPPCLD